MAKVLGIKVNRDRNEGTITFDENPLHLHARRTADGFKLSIPVKIGLYDFVEGEPQPMLSNLHGTVLAGETNGPKMEVGRVYSDDWFTAYRRKRDEPERIHERDESLVWQGSLTELATFEKMREGNVTQL